MARSTKRMCRDCGFFLPLAGALGAMFGVCGNELSADGHVVDKHYGCGAHTDTPAPAGGGSPAYEPFDDGVLDVAQPPPPAPEVQTPTVPEVPEPTPEASSEAAEASSEAPAPEAPEASPEATDPAPEATDPAD